jgi:uncharacterized protein YpmB
MKPNKILYISMFITATILVVVGVVTTSLLVNDKAGETQVKYEQLLNQTTKTQVDYDLLVEQSNQRETQYQQRIQDANQKIEQANFELRTLQNQLAKLEQQQSQQPAVVPTETAQGPVDSSAPTISVEQAAQIAQQVADANQQLTKQPELVSFQGKTAYEAVFSAGSILVDADNGTVLYNGTVPQQISADQASQIVSGYLNNPNVIKVDVIHLGTKPLYRVILKDGTFAYVDFSGQITNVNRP